MNGTTERMNRLICILLFFPMTVLGQANLVPNGSFEEYNFCSSNSQGLGWADSWIVPQQGLTPDYYNACSELIGGSVPSNWVGHQNALHGDAYVGLYAFWVNGPHTRDLVYVQLNDSLIEDSKYVFRMYVSLADDALYSVKRMGMLLTDTVPSSPEPLIGIIPTYFNDLPILDNKDDWVLLKDTITASGGEQYLTLGCFFIDSLCDTVFVGQGEPALGLAYYYIDDVSLIPLDSLLSIENHQSIEVDIYPNPCVDVLNVELVDFSASVEMTVADVNGKIVCANGDCFGRSSLAMTHQGLIDVSAWPSGIYVLKGMDEKGRSFAVKVVKL